MKLDFLSESSAKQRIHFKHQVLFSLKNNEKILSSAAVMIGALWVKIGSAIVYGLFRNDLRHCNSFRG